MPPFVRQMSHIDNHFHLLPEVIRNQLDPQTLVQRRDTLWMHRYTIAKWVPGTWSIHQDLKRQVLERKVSLFNLCLLDTSNHAVDQ